MDLQEETSEERNIIDLVLQTSDGDIRNRELLIRYVLNIISAYRKSRNDNSLLTEKIKVLEEMYIQLKIENKEIKNNRNLTYFKYGLSSIVIVIFSGFYYYFRKNQARNLYKSEQIIKIKSLIEEFIKSLKELNMHNISTDFEKKKLYLSYYEKTISFLQAIINNPFMNK